MPDEDQINRTLKRTRECLTLQEIVKRWRAARLKVKAFVEEEVRLKEGHEDWSDSFPILSPIIHAEWQKIKGEEEEYEKMLMEIPL